MEIRSYSYCVDELRIISLNLNENLVIIFYLKRKLICFWMVTTTEDFTWSLSLNQFPKHNSSTISCRSSIKFCDFSTLQTKNILISINNEISFSQRRTITIISSTWEFNDIDALTINYELPQFTHPNEFYMNRKIQFVYLRNHFLNKLPVVFCI